MPKQTRPATETSRRRIVVIDDHALIRRGLMSMINNEPDLVTCGEAATHQAGMEAVTTSLPDLVTVDLSLGDRYGFELISDIRAAFPALPVLVISMHDEAVYAERAFRAGGNGYITKQQMDETVLVAIRCVLSGDQYMSPVMGALFAKQYLAGRQLEQDTPISRLSNRELEVFRLIGGGQGTRQIAELLSLSIKTIESYRENLKTKLTLHSGVELARAATRWVETDTGTLN